MDYNLENVQGANFLGVEIYRGLNGICKIMTIQAMHDLG